MTKACKFWLWNSTTCLILQLFSNLCLDFLENNRNNLSFTDAAKILGSPSPETKTETENVTLSCQYEGKPKSSVQWFKSDGTPLDPASSSRITITDTGSETSATSSLTITNLNRTDQAKYKCVVSNSIQANVSSAEAQLTVNCKLVSVLHAGCVVSDDGMFFSFQIRTS